MRISRSDTLGSIDEIMILNLKECGKSGDSFNDVISKILEKKN
jgi:predicted CopG family antitoxin